MSGAYEAEVAALSAVCWNPKHLLELEQHGLRPEHFVDPGRRAIYAAMVAVGSRTTQDGSYDIVFLAAQLRRDGTYTTAHGHEGLGWLLDHAPDCSSLGDYVELIRRGALRKKLSDLSMGAGRASTSKDPEAEAMKIQRQLSKSMDFQKASLAPISASIDACLDNILEVNRHGRGQGYTSGIAAIDQITGGFLPGTVIVLAARPSVGKSLIACQAALGIAKEGRAAAFFSLEMGRDELTNRWLSAMSGISATKIKEGFMSSQEATHLSLTGLDLGQLPLWIDDAPAMGADQIDLRCEAIQAQQPLGLIVIDYLQLMATEKGKSRYDGVTDNSRSIKILAKKYQCPVLLLSQLNRAPENRETGKPRLSDLRESGAIEQDADVVVGVHRTNPEESTEIEISVLKNRNGRTGSVKVYVDFERQRLDEG